MRSWSSSLAVALVLAATACGCGRALVLATGVDEVAPAAVARDDQERGGRGGGGPIVFDLRARADYLAGHIPGALSVQPADLDAELAAQPIPAGRRVVTVCYRGRMSLFAAPTLRAYGTRDVRSLAGGMEAWRAAGLPLETGPGRVATAGPRRVALSAFHQVVVFASGMVIKPGYMLLAFVLVVWLWRVRTPTVAMLRRSLALFLAGEGICALEFFLGRSGFNAPLDHVHGLGMVAFGALMPWAVFRLFDERVLHFTGPDERCVLQRFCGRCWKREPVSCGPHRLFLFVAPALAVIALMPLGTPLQTFHFVASVNGSDVIYGMPVLNQIVEFRCYPIVASLLMLWTLWRLRGGAGSVRRAQLPFFLGLGVLGYSIFRFLLTYSYRDVPPWADFWEEVTELVAVLGVGLLLWVFRRPLGLPWRGAAAEVGAAGTDAEPEPARPGEA